MIHIFDYNDIVINDMNGEPDNDGEFISIWIRYWVKKII